MTTNPWIAGLTPEESAAVLRLLLAAHPDLGAEAERIARSVLQDVDFESIADEVADTIRSLDYGDLNASAGSHEWGYVEPGEAATEILEEGIEPFIENLARHIELGLEAEALEICKGVLLGLYRLDKGERCVLVDWAPDFPSEAAGLALEKWRDGGGKEHPWFPEEFVKGFVADWSGMVNRIISRTTQAE